MLSSVSSGGVKGRKWATYAHVIFSHLGVIIAFAIKGGVMLAGISHALHKSTSIKSQCENPLPLA